MDRFRYSAVVAADPAGLEEPPMYLTKKPIYIGQIELECQPQLENTICLSTALLEQWGGPKSEEPYLFFLVDDIVLCDRSALVPFNAPTLILRPRRKEFAAELKKNLAAAKRTTR